MKTFVSVSNSYFVPSVMFTLGWVVMLVISIVYHDMRDQIPTGYTMLCGMGGSFFGMAISDFIQTRSRRKIAKKFLDSRE